MDILDDLKYIVTKTVEYDVSMAKVYKYKSGIFDPIRQEIQGFSYEDGSVLIGIKVWSVGGMRYTLIPPGVDILVGFVNGDAGQPYLAGVDPKAPVVVQFAGTLSGIIGPGTNPIVGGTQITIIQATPV